MAYIDNADGPTREWVLLHEFVLTVNWRNGRVSTYGFHYKATATELREQLLVSNAVIDVTSNFD